MLLLKVYTLIVMVALAGCQKEVKKEISSESRESKRDELVFKLVTDKKVDVAETVLSELQIKRVKDVELLTKSYLKNGKYQTLVKVKFDEGQFENVKTSLDKEEKVEKTFNNYIYEGSPFDMDEDDSQESEENEAVEFDAAHHKLIRTEQALAEARGDGVVVAVTDTGVAYDHRDLVDNIWLNDAENEFSSNKLDECMNGFDEDNNGKVDDCLGWDFDSDDNDPAPNKGSEYHGSHVAGIVASMQNGEGSVGVAPGAKIMSIKFYGENKWTSTTILKSYVYAVDNGAKIINTSFNVDRFVKDEIYHSALEYAEDNGVIVVNSAGNRGSLNPPRAVLNNILFVANTGVDYGDLKADEKVGSSNYGVGIDISAPGYKINSTVIDNKYQTATGTSMSSPVVAGSLALIWSKYPSWTKEQVISRLISTTDNIDAVNKKWIRGKLGSGRVNLEKALNDTKQRSISIAGISKPMKTISDSFKIQTKGVVDWSTLNKDSIGLYRLDDNVDLKRTDYETLIKDAKAKIDISIAEKDKLSYGSNGFTVRSNEGNFAVGKYLIKISADLKDPFGQSMQGNGSDLNTKEDHFYMLSEVTITDNFSPLLEKIEFLGEDILTPDSTNPKLRFSVSDDLTGYKRIVVEFRNTLDFREFHQIRCSQECMVEDGVVEVELNLKSLKTNGTYYVRHILIADVTGKSSAYYVRNHKDEHYFMPDHAKTKIKLSDSFFELRGFKPVDVEKPTLTRDPVVLGSANVNSEFTLSLGLSEKISGMSRVSQRSMGKHRLGHIKRLC